MDPGKPRKDFSGFLRQFALAVDLPFILVGGVLAGGVLGYFLDRWLHTWPALAILLGLLGFAAGLREVLRMLSQGRNRKGQDGGA